MSDNAILHPESTNGVRNAGDESYYHKMMQNAPKNQRDRQRDKKTALQ